MNVMFRGFRWRATVLAAIAVGGSAGAVARYGIADASDGSPWATLGINVVGCLLIGALMVILLELTSPHRLLRPFFGVGVLGGFTTFSTYSVDVRQLIADDRAVVALAYLVSTPLIALLAAWFGGTVMTTIISRRRRRGGA